MEKEMDQENQMVKIWCGCVQLYVTSKYVTSLKFKLNTGYYVTYYMPESSLSTRIHHHHLFLKRPFLPRSARIRCSSRYDRAHITLHLIHYRHFIRHYT